MQVTVEFGNQFGHQAVTTVAVGIPLCQTQQNNAVTVEDKENRRVMIA